MYIDEFKCNEDVANEYSGFYEDYINSEEVIAERDRILNLLNSSEVLIAYYETGCYDGSSFVLFRHEGKLYEVNASHCSCFGLEDQWSAEETNWKALQMRKYYGDGDVLEQAIQEVVNLYKD